MKDRDVSDSVSHAQPIDGLNLDTLDPGYSPSSQGQSLPPSVEPDTIIRLEGGLFSYFPLADTTKRLVRWRIDEGSMDAVVWDVDSSFRQAHRFIPGIPQRAPYLDLGLSFSPIQSCDYFARPPIYNAVLFSQVAMMPFLKHTHTLFSSRGPFSLFEATYNFRTNKAELWASWLFTQNLNPYWNIAIEAFHGDETSGMQRLNTRVNGGQIMLSYARGALLGALSLGYRSSVLMDNGGIQHPRWLTDTVLTRDVLPVRFPETRVEDRNIDTRLHMEYALARYTYEWMDSARRAYLYREPALSLFMAHRLLSASHSYQNPHLNDTLELLRAWGSRIFSNAMSHDSVAALRYEGRLGISFRPSRRRQERWLPSMRGWVGYRAHRSTSPSPMLYLEGYRPSTIHFLFAGGALDARMGPLQVQGDGYLFYRKGRITDARVKAEILYVLLRGSANDRLRLRGEVQWQSRQLPAPLLLFTSNEFQWDARSAAPYLHYVDAQAVLEAPWWGGRYGVRGRLYRNSVYFNAQGMPSRCPRQLVTQAFVEQRLFRWGLSLEMRLMLQKASAEDALHLPLFAGYMLLGYEYELVRHALTARIALEGTYTTAFRGDIYNAALGAYHLQDDFLMGNYPNIDGIVSLKWKTVNVFISVTHAAQGLFGRAQFASTLYPLRPRAVRFGLEWYFR